MSRRAWIAVAVIAVIVFVGVVVVASMQLVEARGLPADRLSALSTISS
jgi:hypothetical protein